MPTQTRFLFDAWYPLALSSDVEPGRPFARTLLELPWVLFRDEQGAVHALDDRCPHRFAPLSLGRIEHGRLQCPYHGLRFDGQGRCVFNPHGRGEIPKAAAVRSLPVIERHGIVWVWPGAPAQGDPALLPALADIDPARSGSTFAGYLRSQADVEIVVDNLLDLSHADYLHGAFLGTNGAILAITPTIEELSDRAVRMTLEMPLRDHPAIPMFQPYLPHPDQPAASLFRITWHAPGLIDLRIEVTQPGPEGPVHHSIHGLHLLSPETATTTHYIVVGQRTMATDNPAMSEVFRVGTLAAFLHEDGPMVQGVQSRLRGQRYADMHPVLLSSDGGTARVRRVFDRLLDQQAARQAARQQQAA